MPQIVSREIGVALDMHGCPNRCRHCYLGVLPNGRMTEEDLRWAVTQFREYVRKREDRPLIEVASSWREPDFSDDYERLAELEAELSDVRPTRYELLSIWRLARDEKYAEWAKRVGPDTCQITFFGMEETQDWFCRRRGAFRDCVRATERLLEVDIKPRWQLFLTKKILPDLDDLMKLVDRMRIRERVQALGDEFVIFIHPPGLVGEGRKILPLSATLEDTKLVPAEIVASTQRHFNTEKIWTTEAETISRILRDPEEFGPPYRYPPEPKLWLFIAGNWDVFSNMGTTDPWWKLGNLKEDPIEIIFDTLENDRILPLKLNRADTLQELAQRYGDTESPRVVNSIEQYWFEKYCEETYRGGTFDSERIASSKLLRTYVQ